jgi:tetratricopeptide (TPR) repeat protein
VSVDPGKGSGWQWLLPASLPAVALVVVPAFASPFLGAKAVSLLFAGAFALFACRVSEARGERSTILPANVLPKYLSKSLCWSAGLWAVAIMASTLHAHNWAECWHVLAPCVAAAFLLIAFIRRRIGAKVMLAAIGVSAVAVAAFAISGHFGYDLPRVFGAVAAPGRMRAASTLGNPLFVASFLSCAVWAVLALPVRSVWRVTAALVIVGGMAATTERTALFAFAAGAIVFALSGRAAFRQRALVLTLLLLLAGWFAFGHVGNPRSLSVAVQGRIFLWKHALRGTTLLGSGPGSFYRVYNRNLREAAAVIPPSQFHFVNYETDSYNIFAQALVENGWLGLTAMLAFLAAWFRLAWRARRNLGACCALAGVATFLASGVCDDPLSRPEGMILLAAWLALPALVPVEGNLLPDNLFQDNAAIFKIESSRLLVTKAFPVIAAAIFLLLLCAAAITAFTNYAVHAGEQAEDRGDWTRAERWDRAALRFDPAQRDARYNLVRVLARSGQYQASLAESEKALDWVNEAELHIIRIRVLPMAGKTQQAQDELTRARKQFPWSQRLQQESAPGGN